MQWPDGVLNPSAGDVEGVRSAPMTEPWLDDACSLVDAFRARRVSPAEVLDACIDAIASSPLNAFSHTDFDQARQAALAADVTLPFGGVPFLSLIHI